MRLKIVRDEEGFPKAHPSTRTYLTYLSEREFSSLEEVETELRNSGPPFKWPDFEKVLDGNPLVGHLPAVELSQTLREAVKPVYEIIEKGNPRPWPRRIYVQHTAEADITNLPYTVTELPVIEQMESATGVGFNTRRVAKIAVEE